MKKVFLILLPIFLLNGCSKECIKSHPEIVKHAARTSLFPHKIGNITTFTPIYHSAYSATEQICDQYES